MASNDLYLRSDVDKGEGPSTPDPDLRLRSDADKVALIPAHKLNTILFENLNKVFGIDFADLAVIHTLPTS